MYNVKKFVGIFTGNKAFMSLPCRIEEGFRRGNAEKCLCKLRCFHTVSKLWHSISKLVPSIVLYNSELQTVVSYTYGSAQVPIE